MLLRVPQVVFGRSVVVKLAPGFRALISRSTSHTCMLEERKALSLRSVAKIRYLRLHSLQAAEESQKEAQEGDGPHGIGELSENIFSSKFLVTLLLLDRVYGSYLLSRLILVF